MKKFNFCKLLLAVAVIAVTFSSCKVYNESMVKTYHQPVSNKIPNVDYEAKATCVIAGADFDIVEKTIKDELTTNIISTENAPKGSMEIVLDKYNLKSNFAIPYLSGLTLFTLNFIGFPISQVEIGMRLKFSIYDEQHNLVKNYSYDVKDKSTMGFYYGKGGRVVLVDVTKKALAGFRKDIERDAQFITDKLNKSSLPPYIQNDYQYVQQPIYAQQQPIQQQTTPIQSKEKESIKSDVDNVPVSGIKSMNTFVLIIANEHYTFVDNVDYAIHDGEIFKEYCVKTLGVPERQVWFYKDASAGIISGGVDKMVQAMSLFENSKAIVYYCGHGIPDEHTGDAYIVPTDGKGTNTATCYSLNKLYTTLAASNATSVTYFMDACFSGANKEGSMLVAAHGVAREPKKEKLDGNTVVFSAASGDETAMTFKEQGHGLFTYYLLKKLQETQGDVSYEDLDKYIKANVKRESFLTNEKVQTPTTNVSENAIESWKGMRLK